jgi:hypothetical protein
VILAMKDNDRKSLTGQTSIACEMILSSTGRKNISPQKKAEHKKLFVSP